MKKDPAKRKDNKIPVQETSPWPEFRHDRRNSGFSPLIVEYNGAKPWTFETAKGVFSSPVIDAEENIYFGSADYRFYALSPSGRLNWSYRCGELIDSAACIGAYDAEKGILPLTFASGDGRVYQVNANMRTSEKEPVPDSSERLLWTYELENNRKESFNNWWEGNVVLGPNGNYYLGNTNFNYYCLSPEGKLNWTYKTGSNAWSAAAFAEDGTIYWGSNDTYVHAVGAKGKRKWRRRTKGIIAASAAIGEDGTVYIGSFDGYFYALEPEKGRILWKFASEDHIYASAAIGRDPLSGEERLFFGSTDGRLYALNPEGGLIWEYDTGSPIRSSPAVTLSPDGEALIVYFGCGNGKVYALHGRDGSRRWSFDSTPKDPELAVRNDLNASPALGRNGVYIGGEHGRLVFIPYDYPLYAVDDPRCSTDPGEELPPDCASLFPVDDGGTVLEALPEKVSAAAIPSFKLVVRKAGMTLPVRLFNKAFRKAGRSLKLCQSDKTFRAEISADGRYLHLIPERLLSQGSPYRLRIEADYYSGGFRFGNLRLGGRKKGRLSKDLVLKSGYGSSDHSPCPLPLSIGEDSVSAIEWTRLAVPFPSMMPSLNQIGFDTYHWIISPVEIREEDEYRGRILFWVQGAYPDEKGLRIRGDRQYLFPLSGYYEGPCFHVQNRGFSMEVTGIPIPFDHFQMRGCLDENRRVQAGASIWAESRITGIPNFGFKMILAGLASRGFRVLQTKACYITRAYDEGYGLNKRRAGITVGRPLIKAGQRGGGIIEAPILREAGQGFPSWEHRASILLYNREKLLALPMDYRSNTELCTDDEGNLCSVRLKTPKSLSIDSDIAVCVFLDAFPARKDVDIFDSAEMTESQEGD